MIKRIGALFVFLLGLFFSFFTVHVVAEDATPSDIPLTELEAFVDTYVDEYVGKTVAGATIIAVKDGRIILSKGYGHADIEEQIPMNPSTSVLEWGSVAKLFVWVSAMQLAEEEKLDLQADIRTYLPEDFLTKLNFDQAITMLDLMHHQAGFEENIFDLLYDSSDHLMSLEETLKLAEPEQVYKPGEVVAYSNYSTSLAAFIIERITGQSFADYAAEHIFTPLGMEHTTMHLPMEEKEEIHLNKTKGYTLEGSGDFQELAPFYISMYPSGGINGTVEDLAKFAQALMPNDTESSPLFQDNQTLTTLLSTSYAPHDGVAGNAHGFWEYDGKYRGLVHGGNTVAFSSNFHIVPEENFAIIVLTNQADEADLTNGLIAELVGQGDLAIQSDTPQTSIVEGEYLSARRTYSGFINLYFYLNPLHITAISDHEIEIDLAGFKANYVQTSPYTYKFESGVNLLLPHNMLYFHVKDGKVEQISTTYADYLPMDKSKVFLMVSLVLFIWFVAYFLISPIILAIFAIRRRRKKLKTTFMMKWNSLLLLSGTAMLINVIVLAVRMLTKPMRAYSELLIHFILNYGLTAINLLAFVIILLYWKKTQLTNMQKFGYILTGISSILFIAWLIVWQFYA